MEGGEVRILLYHHLEPELPNCSIEIILLSSLLPKLHQLAVFFLILQGLYQVTTPLKIILRCMGLFLVHVLTSAIALAINCIVLYVLVQVTISH